MESPNKKSPSVWFNELRGLLTLIFQKVSKLVDRVLFDKKGSVIISLVLSSSVSASGAGLFLAFKFPTISFNSMSLQ